MGKPSGLLVASYLFLILSCAPIDAARVENGKDNIVTSLSTNAVAEVEADWHVFATHEQNCARWQREFQQRTAQVQELSSQMRAGEGGNLQTAQTVLKLRSMTRVYERAATQECQWVAEKDIDTDPLRDMVQENLAENACFPQAQALMTTQWETQQEQVRAMHMATQFLATQQCTDEDAARIAAEMEASTPAEPEELSVQEQLAAANEEADTVTDELVEGLVNQDSSLMQVTEGVNFVPILTELVGLVAFLLIWAVLCILFVPVILMVIGAVLCTLSWVVRRFLGRFNGNLGGCMNWWAHQTQLMFAPGNELVTAGVCIVAGWFGAIPNLNYRASYPNLGIYINGR
jgi:hypothetical protein